MDHNEDDAYEVSSCVGSVALLLLFFCLIWFYSLALTKCCALWKSLPCITVDCVRCDCNERSCQCVMLLFLSWATVRFIIVVLSCYVFIVCVCVCVNVCVYNYVVIVCACICVKYFHLIWCAFCLPACSRWIQMGHSQVSCLSESFVDLSPDWEIDWLPMRVHLCSPVQFG